MVPRGHCSNVGGGCSGLLWVQVRLKSVFRAFLFQAVIPSCLLWKHVVVLCGQRLDAEFPDSVAKPPVSVGKERLFVLLFHEKAG